MLASASAAAKSVLGGTDTALIVVGAIMLSIVACCLCCMAFELYVIIPGWGPIRKFDSDSNEEMRINQFKIHERTLQLEADKASSKKKEQSQQHHLYGTGSAAGLAQPTWGLCEKVGPLVPYPDPVTGPYQMREGFADTQKKRAEEKWWGRDEQYFLHKEGWNAPEATINEVHYMA